jgi:hypothetical protein
MTGRKAPSGEPMLDVDRIREILSRYAEESRQTPYLDLHAHVLALADASGTAIFMRNS